MDAPNMLVRELRLGAGLSQRALARLAGTSQPAVARYERGAATPSWETLQRLAAACGQRLKISAEPIPDPHDVELAEVLLQLTPEERLRALRRYAHMHELAQEQQRGGASREADAPRVVGRRPDVENSSTTPTDW